MSPFIAASSETERLAALRSHDILDTAAEECFDILTRIAGRVTGCPFAWISFVDEDRLWIKARTTPGAPQIPRINTFRTHALMDSSQALVVRDTTRDPRFMTHPMVVGHPYIRFYAGAPIVDSEDRALGVICAFDHEAKDIHSADVDALKGLAVTVMTMLESRRVARESRLVALERKRLGQVVEAAPSAFVMINREGRIEMVNVQAERMFGYLRDEMLGEPIERLLPARFRALHPALRAAFDADPHPRLIGASRDLYAVRKDGSEFPVEIGINPIETEGGGMVLSAIADISAHKDRQLGIQAALREKEILLGEIHHRVKNNLQIVYSLLSLQSMRIDDAAVRDILRDSQNRIRSMALIHQTLYESRDFAKVDFGRFLRTLVPILIGSYDLNSDRISVDVDVETVLLPIDLAVPCGLMVNELITNAFKHAFTRRGQGNISISLTALGKNEVALSVSDDGIGLSNEIDTAHPISLGLQLVTLLADQVGGTLNIHRASPTRFELRFPIQTHEAPA